MHARALFCIAFIAVMRLGYAAVTAPPRPPTQTPSTTVHTTPELQTVACPDDILAHSSTGDPVVLDWPPPNAPSGLDTVTGTHNPGDSFRVGSTIVLYVFSDSLGSRQESCTFNVTVLIGDAPPVITCPNDVTALADAGTLRKSVTWPDVPEQQAEFRLSYQNYQPGDVFVLGVTVVAYQWQRQSQEEYFTCSFTVTVDTRVKCPEDVVAYTAQEATTVTWTPPSAPESTGDVSTTSTLSPGDVFPIGPTVVRYDFVGQSLGIPQTCNFTVEVIFDDVLPIVICPDNITGVAPQGAEGRPTSWEEPEASDDSEGVRLRNQSHRSGQIFPLGTTVVTYEFEDLAGNVGRCSFRITVEEEYVEPITVTNCPVAGFNLSVEYIRGTPGNRLGIISPRAEGPRTYETRVPGYERYFDVGVTPVVYTFTDVSNPRNTAKCAFNLTIIPQCGNPDHTLCDGGSQTTGDVCKPTSTLSLCESEGSGYSESTSYEESQGFSGANCEDKICGDVGLLDSCTDSHEWQDAMATDYPEGDIGFVSRFAVPAISQDSIHLTAVRVAWGQFDELYSPEITGNRRGVFIFVDISTPLRKSVENFWVYPGLTTPETAEVTLQVPHSVQPGDIIAITVGYVENRWYPCYDPRPIQSRCTDCLSIQFRTLAADCEVSDTCLRAYQWWKGVQAPDGSDMSQFLRPPPLPGYLSCMMENHDTAIEEIVKPCLSPAEFQYVSPDQTAAVGESVSLVCVGTGLVQPVVEWYDVNDVVQVRGNGSAVLRVSVESTPQSFQCFLDRYTKRAVMHETVTTVSPIAGECASLSAELRQFSTDESGCFSLSKRMGYGRYAYFLTDWMTEVFIFQITVSSSVLRGELVNQYGKDAVPDVVSVVLEMSPDYSLPQRKRRGARRPVLEMYRRQYDSMYVPNDPATILKFDLTPPLRANASFGWAVFFSVPNLRRYGGRRGEEIGQPPLAVALNCSKSTSPACTDDLVAPWSNELQRYDQAGCDTDRSNRSLHEAFRICRNISVADPQIVVSPSSADVTGIGEEEPATVTFDCYIENAVEYRWYKTAPAPSETFIRTGNQLVFQGFLQSRDQGAYVCEGIPGKSLENENVPKVRTEPATLTLTEVTTFKVTMKLLNPTYTEDLAVTDSEDFRNLQSELERSFWYPVTGNLQEEMGREYGIEFEILAFRRGSIVAEVVVFFRRFRFRGECEGPCTLTEPTGDLALQERLTAAIQERPETSELMVESESINVVNLVSCLQEVYLEGNLTFPQTRLGQTAQSLNLCPHFTTRAGMPRATRDCVGDFTSQPQWKEPVILKCFEGDVTENLDELANMPVTSENAEEVAQETASLTSNASAISPMALTSVAGILKNLVDANNTSPEVAVQIVEIVNNVLQIDDEAILDEASRDNSPSLIVLSLESFVTALHNSGAGNFTEVQSSVAVQALSLPRRALSNGLGFASSLGDPGTNDLTDNQTYVFTKEDPPMETEASIFLPAEILDKIPKTGDSEQVPISFFLYQNSRLFRSPTLNEVTRPEDRVRRAVGSRVIAATVEGVKIDNLRMPVSSVFSLLNASGENETVGSAECVFWDFTLNNGYGDWSTEGCRNESLPNGVIRCLCDHLTSFAVIVDIHGQQDSVFLDVISKIGCAVSVVALIITLVTYLYSKKIRTKRPQQILISLCFALLGLYFMFLVGIEATASRGGCTFVAVSIHYFTLASIAWMAVEATNMYLLFVRVLNANVSHFLLKASIAAWGLPLVIVVIILAADYTQYEHPNYCFLKPGNAIYYGQILPIGLVLLFNFVIFTLVTRKLTCARKTIGSSSDKSHRQERLRRLQNAVAISVLLGLTWVFGLLSVIQAASFAFQVLFAICNSLQGLMIFVLFCARQKEVHQVWREMFPCKRDAQRRGAVSGTGLDSSTRGGIPLSSKGTKTTDFSEASQTQS
ncbi:uncharacterized protein LOC119726669 isoform X2 [Patiria miniata]|uniref:G-protein coupled receptor n=1 Tax=Patiria miniata TaxID=46514 RepID=A0A913ZRV3_PATMI|nr:uncharacterized protein LOC119726669 isoform X2 [Patiria miniata]